MTANTMQSTLNQAITRCAVCKVDLKGRFVYVDDRTAQLLGTSSEDLFGKSFADFLDPASRDAVREVLTRRNHYETFYDSLCITLIDRDGNPNPAAAIVSLNFNGGNPVNFQWILNPGTARYDESQSGPGGDAFREFTDYIIENDPAADWRGYLQRVRKFTGAAQTCVYIVTDDHLEPRCCATEIDSPEAGFDQLPEPGPMHVEVARTGAPYDFTDQDAVRRAVEQDTVAPNEVVGSLSFDQSTAFLVRVMFDADLEDAAARDCAGRARFALRMTDLLRATAVAGNTDNSEDDLRFTVGLLDGLGLGCLAVDSSGQIALYNPSFIHALGLEELDGDMDGLITILHDIDPGVSRQDLVAYLQPNANSGEDRPEAPILIMRSGAQVRLLFLSLGQAADDRCAVIGLAPAGKRDRSDQTCAFWATAAELLRKDLHGVSEAVRGLDSNKSSRCVDDHRATLSDLEATLSEAEGLLVSLRTLAKVVTISESTTTVDLNEMITSVGDAVARAFPDVQLDFTLPPLPAVQVESRKMRLALENLLAHITRSICAPQVGIEAAAHEDGPYCLLTVTGVAVADTQAADGKRQEDDLPVPKMASAPAVELAAAELLLDSMNGALVEHVTDDSRVELVCRLPLA